MQDEINEVYTDDDADETENILSEANVSVFIYSTPKVFFNFFDSVATNIFNFKYCSNSNSINFQEIYLLS